MFTHQRTRQKRAEYRELSNLEWSKICSIPWTTTCQAIIGILLAHKGLWPSEEAFKIDMSDVKRINLKFQQFGLPYRLCFQVVFSDQVFVAGVLKYWTQRQQLQLCTIIPPSTRVR